MNTDNEKIKKLISIAKLYYLENMIQSEITKIVEVSCPLFGKGQRVRISKNRDK